MPDPANASMKSRRRIVCARTPDNGQPFRPMYAARGPEALLVGFFGSLAAIVANWAVSSLCAWVADAMASYPIQTTSHARQRIYSVLRRYSMPKATLRANLSERRAVIGFRRECALRA